MTHLDPSGTHLWVDERLSGWYAHRSEAEADAKEYRSEGRRCRVTEGTMKEAAAIWAAERSESARKGWRTRRVGRLA